MSKNEAAPKGGAGSTSAPNPAPAAPATPNPAPKTNTKPIAAGGKTELPNPTDNWRETDKKMIADIQGDRNKVPTEKSRKSKSENNLKKGNAIAAGGFAVVAVVEVVVPDVVVVVDASASAPNMGNSSIVKPGKAFDPKILDDPDVLALTLPPEDQPNYVQCPHCGKRFEPSAAARHIPQCKQYYFNLAEKEKFAGTKKKK